MKNEIPEGFQIITGRNDHTCFGCGPRNPSGLQMRFFSDGRSVRSWLSVPDHLCGWDRIAHGGVISTILDEVMSWAAIYLLKRVILTESITVDFLKAVGLGENLQAEGRVLELKDRKKAIMEGTLTNGDGQLCARSTGRFVMMRPEVARRIGIMDNAAIEGFAPLLKADS